MTTDNPYEALKKIFHEPKRLAIMSALCAAPSGMTFKQLKTECELTDGNLNRHLKVLEEADAVSITKKFVGSKPQTSVTMSASGVEQFNEYLAALSQVLLQAQQAMPAEKKQQKTVVIPDANPVEIETPEDESPKKWKSYGVYL